MTDFDAVKDSGERQEWSTGSRRDTNIGKGRYDLIPPYFVRRLAQHLENGARKYGDRNWELGQPLSRYLDSALRHTFNLLDLAVDEDHPSAGVWNLMAFLVTAERIKDGHLPAELDDLGYVDALRALDDDEDPDDGFDYDGQVYLAPLSEERWQNVGHTDGGLLAEVDRVNTDLRTLLDGASVVWGNPVPRSLFVDMDIPEPVLSDEKHEHLKKAIQASLDRDSRKASEDARPRIDFRAGFDEEVILTEDEGPRTDFRAGDRVEAFGAITGRRAVLRRDLQPNRWEMKFADEDVYSLAKNWDDDSVRLLLAGVPQNLLEDAQRV